MVPPDSGDRSPSAPGGPTFCTDRLNPTRRSAAEDDARPMPRLRAALLLLALALTAIGPAVDSGERDTSFWQWPVDPPRAVVNPFVAPATAYSAGHRGVDIAAPGGGVRAPASGVVRFAGVVVDRPVLSIDHGGGVISSYEPVVASVAKGDSVSRGQPIGAVSPGHCVTRCLHFGVRVDGQYVSPMGFFGDIPRSILLPMS